MEVSKKTQIVYCLSTEEKWTFLEELYCSVYSLRLYDVEREVRVLCDESTSKCLSLYPQLKDLITEVIVIPLEEKYNTTRLKSRQIKTSVRKYVKGSYLFVDTDTVFCGTIEDVDTIECDIAAVYEYHLPLSKSPFRNNVINNIKRAFDVDVSKLDQWHNSGVIYVADNDITYEFYSKWNENWNYSAFVKGQLQDEPAFNKTDMEMRYIINELPDIFNCQLAMSVKYLAEAKIIHFLHMYFPQKQSFCPFMDKSIYGKIRGENGISKEIVELIKNVKQSFTNPSCVVGWQTMNFLSSPVEPVFEKIYNDGGLASWLMIKFAKWLNVLHKYTKK